MRQWRNSRGAECPPDTSHRQISADELGKERQGKIQWGKEKRENVEESKENRKTEGGN